MGYVEFLDSLVTGLSNFLTNFADSLFKTELCLDFPPLNGLFSFLKMITAIIIDYFLLVAIMNFLAWFSNLTKK